MEKSVPEFVTRQRAAAELCMSDDTFDKYVKEGVLPSPKRRGKLARWKWSEIVAALDGGDEAVLNAVEADDPIMAGVKRAKETDRRAA